MVRKATPVGTEVAEVAGVAGVAFRLLMMKPIAINRCTRPRPTNTGRPRSPP
jgi:hypothetical protein